MLLRGGGLPGAGSGDVCSRLLLGKAVLFMAGAMSRGGRAGGRVCGLSLALLAGGGIMLGGGGFG